MEYRVSEADLHQEGDAIRSFWRENLTVWPQEKFTWFYQANPCQSAVCCALRTSEDDSVIGTAALFPRRFTIQGNTYIGAIAGDLAVHQKHRLMGAALTLQRTILAAGKNRGIDFVYGLPNRKSEPVHKRVGYRVIGSGTKLVKVLRSHYKVRERVKIPLVSHLASGIIDLFTAMTSRERRLPKAKGFATEIRSSFDSRFDGLFNRAARHYPIVAERTQSSLNWRFTQCPYRDYRVFTLIRNSTGEVAGYIVYDHADRTVRIVDLFAEDKNQTLEVLLAEFLSAQRKEPVDRVSINFFGDRSIMSKLKRFNFMDRVTGGNVNLYVDPTHPCAETLADRNNWFLLDGDNDV